VAPPPVTFIIGGVLLPGLPVSVRDICIAALRALIVEAWLVLSLVVYTVMAAVGCHLLLMLYQQPTLRERFRANCELYGRNVRRWIHHVPRQPRPTLNKKRMSTAS
jgi:hypothetical protein